MNPTYYAGLDLGSSYAKCVIIDQNKAIISKSIQKTGFNFHVVSENIFSAALNQAAIDRSKISRIISTGVGRTNCQFAFGNKPEISCLAKAGNFHHQGGCIIVDIGGQDNKVIKLSETGRQVYFKMNRKCAAGTGSFLEEISNRLETSSESMNRMAMLAKTSVEIGSYCTVFTGTEIVHHIREGQGVNEIIKGVFESVAKRILEMDPLDEFVIFTGGAIASNPALVEVFRTRLKYGLCVLPDAQIIGAFGAALYALEPEED